VTAPGERAAADGQPSQRDRLLGRPRPSLPHRILVDPDGAAAARDHLAVVQRRARQVLLKADDESPEAAQARAELADAEAAVEACYETIVLHALPPARLAELEAEHPPTPEQMVAAQAERQEAHKRGELLPEWPAYADAFWPAVLAESAVDADMTVQDWSEFLAERVSAGERAGLRVAVLNVNRLERVADPLVLPKGLTPTVS
jgi:hypothetical protein